MILYVFLICIEHLIENPAFRPVFVGFSDPVEKELMASYITSRRKRKTLKHKLRSYATIGVSYI
jgi:hypothetical protein